jgi:hypothetical protein
VFNHNHRITALALVATIPIFLWELSRGVWLVAKGFDPTSPILTESVARQSREVTVETTA